MHPNQSAIESTAGSPERYKRAARVIAGWLRDRDFSDAMGNPRSLPLQADAKSGGPSFAELARRFSGDVPFRTLLDELTRVGVVEQLGDGSIRLRR